MVLGSCNTDEPLSPNENGQQQPVSNSDSNSNNSNNHKDEKYYFELDFPAAREIKTEAGSTQIFFKCNQEYTVSATGNITGLKLSHTYGTGTGSIIVSFDKVQYNDRGSDITWSESGHIIFTAKEGVKSNFNVVKKEFYLFRRGSKAKI